MVSAGTVEPNCHGRNIAIQRRFVTLIVTLNTKTTVFSGVLHI